MLGCNVSVHSRTNAFIAHNLNEFWTSPICVMHINWNWRLIIYTHTHKNSAQASGVFCMCHICHNMLRSLRLLQYWNALYTCYVCHSLPWIFNMSEDAYKRDFNIACSPALCMWNIVRCCQFCQVQQLENTVCVSDSRQRHISYDLLEKEITTSTTSLKLSRATWADICIRHNLFNDIVNDSQSQNCYYSKQIS